MSDTDTLTVISHIFNEEYLFTAVAYTARRW